MDSQLAIELLETLSLAQEAEFWLLFEAEIAIDDGAAAKSHLESGRPIYYCDDNYPDAMIQKFPNGELRVVQIGRDGEITPIANL